MIKRDEQQVEVWRSVEKSAYETSQQPVDMAASPQLLVVRTALVEAVSTPGYCSWDAAKYVWVRSAVWRHSCADALDQR